MEISAIDTIPVILEATPFATSYGSIDKYLNVIVRVEAEGLEGWGEASPWLPNEMGETQGTVLEIIDRCLKPVLIGMDPREIAKIHHHMDCAVRGHPIAKAAIDMAIYDLVGKQVGLRVCALLGGAFRETMPTVGDVGVEDEPEQMANRAKEQVEIGYRILKVKLPAAVIEKPVASVERVKLIRKAIGDEIVLIVDLNQGWVTSSNAIRAIRRIEDDDNLYIEQPVLSLDYDGLAEVATSVRTPIIADESAFTEYGILEIVRRKAPSIINVKMTRPGGIHKAHRLITLARAAGLQCQIDDVVQTRISTTASAHLAASVPEESFFCYAGGNAHLYLKDDIVQHGGIDLQATIVKLPVGAGLGIEVNRDLLERYAIKGTRHDGT